MSTENSIFSGFSSAKPKANVLSAGEHKVQIARLFETDSMTEMSGARKDNDLPYVDACPQFGVMFRGEKGVITVRFNGKGYYRTADFTEQEMEDNNFVDGNGFAMATVKDAEGNDVFTRIQHEERSEACKNIFNQFFAGVGLPEGSSVADIKPEMELVIRIEQSDYNGRPQNNVVAYRKVIAGEIVDADAKAPVASL